MDPALALQLVPDVGLPGVLTTLVVAVVALLAVRFLLNIALKVAVVAAVAVAVLWFFGALSLLPF